MKVNGWIALLLVMIGTGVGAMSLYTASVSGVMGKMGLVGGDFSQAIKVNELARQTLMLPDVVECGTFQVASKVPRYLFSKGEERVKLAGERGGERIVCGVKHVQDQNVERGVYTIVKGLYYLKTHYSELRVIISEDQTKCQLLADPHYERWVEAYLSSTEGRIHEVVLEVYKHVQESRARVEELCLD
jgi:hypothetical protein